LPTAPDTKLYKSNTSGWKGEFLTTNGRYAVSIQAYGDRKHLGVFGTFAEACGAQWAAKSCYMVSTLEKLADRQRGPAMCPYFYRQPPKAADLRVSPSKLTLRQTLAELQSMAARGIGQRYRLRSLKVRHIDRDLISRSIGIDPLYDRRRWSGGCILEKS
jgi:hypothetical protein